MTFGKFSHVIFFYIIQYNTISRTPHYSPQSPTTSPYDDYPKIFGSLHLQPPD